MHVGSNSTSGVDSGIYAVSLFATREGLTTINDAGRFNKVDYESSSALDSHGIFEIFEEDVLQNQGMRLSVLFGEEASFQKVNRAASQRATRCNQNRLQACSSEDKRP